MLFLVSLFCVLITQMWPDLINKAKLGGLDAIDTYVFWNAHEPYHRMYNFSANLNLIRFLKTIQAGGLYAVLRIGPYVCAEWNFGYVHLALRYMCIIDLTGLVARITNECISREKKILLHARMLL